MTGDAHLPACLLCASSADVRLSFELTRPVYACRACGLMFAPRPASISAGDAFPEEYYRGGVYADYTLDRLANHRNAQRVLTELEQRASGRRLLDVGCALGFFLEAAQHRGWETRGLEVSPWAAERARRELDLAVDLGSIESPPADLGPFDVITLWDAIEHLERPDRALAEARRLLRPGGWLALSTADSTSLVRRLTGRRWRIFQDPTHLFFFDEPTLRRLLARAGFEVAWLRRRGKHVSLPMILHQSPLPYARAIERWLLRHGRQPHLYVNLFDMMTVVARASEKPAER